MMPHYDDEEEGFLDWIEENQLPVCAVIGLIVVLCAGCLA